MQKDLLAPPTLSTRKFGLIVAIYCTVAMFLGSFLALCDWISVRDWLESMAWITLLNAAAFLLYRRLMAAIKDAKPERMLMLNIARSLVVAPAWFYTLDLVFSWGFGAFRNVMPWWMLPFMLGIVLARGGMARRVGESKHCPKCDYKFQFDGVTAPPLQCPECGTPWLGLLKQGRREKSPKWIAAGVAITVGSFLLLNPVFFMSSLAPHLPTPLLWVSLRSSPSHAYAVWDELEKRPLDDWWIRTITERALILRKKDQWDSGPGGWVESLAAAGKIPEDLLTRFYHEGMRAELVLPEHVRVGEGFLARLRVKYVAHDGTTNLGVIFGGYTVGDSTQPVGRGSETEWTFQMRPFMFERYKDAEEQMLKADHRGQVRVHAVYWMVYMPSFWPTPPNWQADGTPEKPSQALWFERVDLEKFVQVD